MRTQLVAMVSAVIVAILGAAWASREMIAQTPALKNPDRPAAAKDKPLTLPKGWNPDDPLPTEKTNCVRCHLTAGRELTTPVRDFARSIHDLVGLSCNNCHGGNTKDDTTAHEAQHDFIGTKLSAHMAACSACHDREAQRFRRGKHYRDLSKGINRDYPICIDCHGNHDIGKPPSEFSLTNVCTDCHKQFAKDMPEWTSLVSENDRLWKVMREVQAKNKKADDPIPEKFRKEWKAVRSGTARLIHPTAHPTAAEAQRVNDKTKHLRDGLEHWLKNRK